MLRWILLIVGVVAVSAAVPIVVANLPANSAGGSSATVNRESKGPHGRVEVEGELVHDFGILAQLEKGEKTYKFTNVGEAPLTLEKGKSTCTCTVADFERDPRTGIEKPAIVLEPGESTTITVGWNTKELEGEFERETSILTSDPLRPEVTFRVVGEVQPTLMTEPKVPNYDFGPQVSNSTSVSAPLRIASADRPDFKILSIDSTAPESVDATYRPLEEAELPKGIKAKVGGYVVTIEVKPSETIGDFAEILTITTDNPKRTEVKVPVHGRRVGPIRFNQPSIRIADATPSDGGSQDLVLIVTDRDQTNFEVAKAPEGVEIAIEPMDSSKSKAKLYRLTATVAPGMEPGLIRDEIVLTTDHPGASRLSLPITVIISSPGN